MERYAVKMSKFVSWRGGGNFCRLTIFTKASRPWKLLEIDNCNLLVVLMKTMCSLREEQSCTL